MGSSEVQGELWGRAPVDWAELMEPVHTPLWEAMLDATQVGEGTNFLDVGCGGGGASILAADRGAQISGIDASEPLLDVARQRVPAGDFRVGDLEALPFDSGTFGAVIAASSIQYAEDPVAALRELKRVCRPNGRVAVSLFGPPEKVAFGAIFAAIRDALPEPPSGGGPFALSAVGVLEGLVEQAGMPLSEVSEVDVPMRFTDVDTFLKAAASGGPTQRAIEAIGEEAFNTAVLGAIEPFQTDDGGLLINNVYRYVMTAQGT